MMVKHKETGQEKLCQLDSIPFIPDDAKVKSLDCLTLYDYVFV